MDDNAKCNGRIITTRLDAIVTILLRLAIGDEKRKLKIGDAVRLLHQIGYTPTEIAKSLGKKRSSEVAPYLYSKKKKKM